MGLYKHFQTKPRRKVIEFFEPGFWQGCDNQENDRRSGIARADDLLLIDDKVLGQGWN